MSQIISEDWIRRPSDGKWHKVDIYMVNGDRKIYFDGEECEVRSPTERGE